MARRPEVGERRPGRPSIAVVDYGAGNLTSVLKGLTAAGGDPFLAIEPAQLAAADGVIIPGVGHFGATGAISGPMRAALHSAIDTGQPVLGICLGLQFLFEGSDEAPGVPGLALLAGRCALLPPTQKVPHVGWNDLHFPRPSQLFAGVPEGSQVYFTHSYAAPITDACAAETDYTSRFAAAVERENVFGVQFHPEKSGDVGLTVLRSFVSFASFASFRC